MSAEALSLSEDRANGWMGWLARELAPTPGRQAMTLRLVVGVVIVVLISMSLQVPEAALSAYMVFFVNKRDLRMTTLAGLLLTLGATIAISSSLLLFRITLDAPALRVVAMGFVIFCGMFAARALVIGPLGFAIGFVAAVAQSIVDGAHTPEIAVRELLWVWVVIVYPIALTVLIHHLAPAEQTSVTPAKTPKPHPKGLFVANAFRNPANYHFALKVTLAAMTCYVIYTGLDWSGIHTSFITCCFVALETTEASLNKASLRLAGCALGGLLGFFAILYVVPFMESIVSLCLLTAIVSALAGWVAAGSERIAYAGLQIAFAFYLSIFQGFAPGTDFDVIRDRVLGIILGICVLAVVYHYLWPEESRGTAARAA